MDYKTFRAKTRGNDALINDISKWIEKRSLSQKEIASNLLHTVVGIIIQYKIFQDWFQTKMHPEYKYNFKLVFGFFVEIQSKFKQDIKQQRS